MFRLLGEDRASPDRIHAGACFTMLQTHIVDIAIRLDTGFRFVAADPRAGDAGETLWPTLVDIRRVTRLALLRSQPAGPVQAVVDAHSLNGGETK
jgi:hypothetical protein